MLRLASDVLPSSHLSISQQKALAVLRETFSSDGATKSEWERACQDIPGRTFHRAAKVLAERRHVKVLNSRYRVIGEVA